LVTVASPLSAEFDQTICGEVRLQEGQKGLHINVAAMLPASGLARGRIVALTVEAAAYFRRPGALPDSG